MMIMNRKNLYKVIEHNTTLYIAIPYREVWALNINKGDEFFIDTDKSINDDIILTYTKFKSTL